MGGDPLLPRVSALLLEPWGVVFEAWSPNATLTADPTRAYVATDAITPGRSLARGTHVRAVGYDPPRVLVRGSDGWAGWVDVNELEATGMFTTDLLEPMLRTKY
jgi:hypothetical protein